MRFFLGFHRLCGDLWDDGSVSAIISLAPIAADVIHIIKS